MTSAPSNNFPFSPRVALSEIPDEGYTWLDEPSSPTHVGLLGSIRPPSSNSTPPRALASRDFEERKEPETTSLMRRALEMNSSSSPLRRGTRTTPPRPNQNVFPISRDTSVTHTESRLQEITAWGALGDRQIKSRRVLSHVPYKELPRSIPDFLLLPKSPFKYLDTDFQTAESHFHLVAYSKEGLMAVSFGDAVYIRNEKTGKIVKLKDPDYDIELNPPVSLAFDPQNPSRLAVGTAISTVDYWDLSGEEPVRLVSINIQDPTESNHVTVLAFKNDDLIAGTSSGQLIRIFLNSRKPISAESMPIFDGTFQNLLVSPDEDGRYLLASGTDVGVKETKYEALLFKFNRINNSYSPPFVVDTNISDFNAMAFAPNSQFFALGTIEKVEDRVQGEVSIYEIKGGKSEMTLTFILDEPATHLFWPNPHSIISTHKDGSIQSHSICFRSKKVFNDLNNSIGAFNAQITYAAMAINDLGIATLVTAAPLQGYPERAGGGLYISKFQATKPKAPAKPSHSKMDDIVIR